MRLIPAPPGPDRPAPLDLADPTIHATDDPHAAWRWARAHAPVSWQPTGGLGFWSVTRHADVRIVLRDHQTFTSERGTLLTLLGKPDPASGRQLAATDPPRHTRMRAPLHGQLDTAAVARHAPMIRARVATLLSDLPEEGVVDLAGIFNRLPVAVLSTLMGLPDADWDRLTRLAMMAIAPDDETWQLPRGPVATLQRAHRELFAYFQDQVRQRQRRGGDDLIGTLLALQVDGAALDPGAVLSNCYSLLLGAAVTVPNVPTAALLELARSGDYGRLSAAGPRLDLLVEEALRWASPANHFLRHTTRETELGGVQLPAGAPVVVWLGSANRDESVFVDPYVFVPDRQPNRHVALGGGAHYCIGYALARLMLTAVFDEFFARVAEVRPVDGVRHIRSTFAAGFTHAPVRVTRRTSAGTGGAR
ncbi:cytochrome P450 [Micromonospora marina]|uniref:Cytochrome P450 n=1 Tax=Micromonospora marina TaxID=307120 RepID=A0A1C5AJU2_9ACTN|nr:cytochrome P450 [Micromonospora marina]SCF45366.1 Cytochrome P450 [Micromonospora marina]